MRRLYRGLIICLICSAISSALAVAGEYHNPRERTATKTQDTLACAQCHTMHGSQGAGAGAGSLIYSGTAAIYPMLLRQANVLELCLFCHSNNQAAGQIESGRTPPDIWSGSGTGKVEATPGGGAVNSAGLLCAGGSAVATPPCGDNKISHTIDVNANVTPPGWTGAEVPLFTPVKGGFVCINCHDQHGNTNYRNLRNMSYRGVNFTGVDVSYNMGTDVASPNCSDGSTSPCFVQNIDSLNNAPTGLLKYVTSNVKFRKPPTDSANQGIQAFCKRCHNNFHFASIDASAPTEMGGSALGDTAAVIGDEWKRHPMMDVTISEANTNLHADGPYWGTATWWPRVIDPNGTPGSGDEIPFCFSCHRVHGSTNHSNLIFGDPTISVGGDGTMMRITCLQCHNQ